MKILLVDDEVQIVNGIARMISCEEDEWDVETALSGLEALELMSKESFDVVVSDMRMPNMDGAELLDQIEKLYPSTLRVILSGQADRESVLRAVRPMHQYLSKPCEPDKLFEVIGRANIFQETIRSAELLDAIGRAGRLPTFPAVVNEINNEIESENGSATTISEIVSRDPLLSAKVLQLANSAIFSLPQPVSDLERAVSLVGLDMLKAIAMSQSVYAESKSGQTPLSVQALQDHSFSVGLTGKRLAKHAKTSLKESNEVFMAGLLHDVGKLILADAFPDRYEEVLAKAKSGGCLQELEMEAFGAVHQGIGGYLFGLWGLPQEVVTSVASHHSFDACAESTSIQQKLVFASNWIVRNRSGEQLQQLVDSSQEIGRAHV